MSASLELAESMSDVPLTMNVLMIGARTSVLRPWMYALSSTPCSCTASINPDLTRSAITSGSSSTKTPTFDTEGSTAGERTSSVSRVTNLLLGLWRTNPTMSGSRALAALTSSRLLSPQILTSVIASWPPSAPSCRGCA